MMPLMLSLMLAVNAAFAVPVDSTVLITTGASVCAGVVIAEDRVATAYHCIAGGGRPMVENQEGTRVIGRVLYARPRDDLAVIAVTMGMPVVPLAEAPPEPGQAVSVVGHPFGTQEMAGYMTGLLRYSVSSGIVSGLGPRAMQTTAPVNPGNSGGPVFDEQGQVVGIVSRRLRGDGLGFATRVERLAALLDDEQRPSPIGGTIGVHAVAGAWGGADGTLSVGGELWMSFRDRVVASAQLTQPVSPRWDAMRFGEVRWLAAEGHLELRQRFLRGKYTGHVGVYGGAANLASRSGNRETFRVTAESAWHPMVGTSVGFGSVVLDAGWVIAPDEVGVRGQMRFAWPGRLWIF
ncbi:MAG: serine protease [Deltaproteobacteria bacterium]|nr:MAG: serine protease [Deltaproteobacteria bacterium]